MRYSYKIILKETREEGKDMDLKIFENEKFGEVIILENNGKFEFGATEVAKALGYTNPRDAIQRHCKKRGVVKHDVPHPQSKNKTISKNFIDEGNLYRLITHSKLPEAEKFERWVFDEILPTIRKTGGYIAGEKNLSDEELVERAFLVVKNKLEQREKQLKEQEPKVRFAESITASKDSKLINELAKLLSQNGYEIGQNRLYEKLRDEGYLIKARGDLWNLPTQRSMDLGLFEIEERAIFLPSGTKVNRTTRVTTKGMEYFINKFLRGGILC